MAKWKQAKHAAVLSLNFTWNRSKLKWKVENCWYRWQRWPMRGGSGKTSKDWPDSGVWYGISSQIVGWSILRSYDYISAMGCERNDGICDWLILANSDSDDNSDDECQWKFSRSSSFFRSFTWRMKCLHFFVPLKVLWNNSSTMNYFYDSLIPDDWIFHKSHFSVKLEQWRVEARERISWNNFQFQNETLNELKNEISGNVHSRRILSRRERWVNGWESFFCWPWKVKFVVGWKRAN